MEFDIFIADKTYQPYAEAICEQYAISAQERGTGIAKRKPEYVRQKMENGNAIIAFHEGKLAGFCYVEVWSHDKYVANSGLIIVPAFRKHGLARIIKKNVFQLARNKYPTAKVFGITTSLAVMKINYDLGYQPVTFSELTQDDAFWLGCQSCPNFDILQRNERKLCLCTGMLAPSKEEVEMKVNLTKMIVENDK